MNERIRELSDQVLPNEKEFHKGDPKDWGYFFSGDELEKFAELIVAAEREACALVCEQVTAAWSEIEYNEGCMDCARAIRARGRTWEGDE